MLKPSTREGVGVFARHAITAGTLLRLFPDPPERWLSADQLTRRTPEQRDLIERFGVDYRGGLSYPHDLGCMAIGWYLNHAVRPNAAWQRGVYRAVRTIRAGDEVTIDYRTL